MNFRPIPVPLFCDTGESDLLRSDATPLYSSVLLSCQPAPLRTHAPPSIWCPAVFAHRTSRQPANSFPRHLAIASCWCRAQICKDPLPPVLFFGFSLDTGVTSEHRQLESSMNCSIIRYRGIATLFAFPISSIGADQIPDSKASKRLSAKLRRLLP
jgi:hypothetical protein